MAQVKSVRQGRGRRDMADVTRDRSALIGSILGHALLKLKLCLFRRKVVDVETFQVGIELVIRKGFSNLFRASCPAPV